MMRVQLTDYDAGVVRAALLQCRENAPIFAGKIGNESLKRLALRFDPKKKLMTDQGQNISKEEPSEDPS